MASLRGSQVIWTAQAVTGSSAGADISPRVHIGVGVNVALFITNTGGGSATFKVQAGVLGSGALSAGLNAVPDIWADYTKPGGTVITLVVGAGTSLMVDLSPFAPESLRLISSAGSSTVTAVVTSVGVN